MKLQYLGDARDAFKWDLLHWICTRAEPSLAGCSLFLFLLLTTLFSVMDRSHTYDSSVGQRSAPSFKL
jgi:hypothetical protein